MYTHEVIIKPIITSCRVSTPETIEFRSKLGFTQHDVILTKEESMISKKKKIIFEPKSIATTFCFRL